MAQYLYLLSYTLLHFIIKWTSIHPVLYCSPSLLFELWNYLIRVCGWGRNITINLGGPKIKLGYPLPELRIWHSDNTVKIFSYQRRIITVVSFFFNSLLSSSSKLANGHTELWPNIKLRFLNVFFTHYEWYNRGLIWHGHWKVALKAAAKNLSTMPWNQLHNCVNIVLWTDKWHTRTVIKDDDESSFDPEYVVREGYRCSWTS